jgi:hypothetical protein
MYASCCPRGDSGVLGAFNPLAGFSAPSPNLSLAARVLLLHRASPPTPPTTSLTALVRRPVVVVVVPRHPLDTALVVVLIVIVILVVVVLVVVVDATRADIIAVFASRCRSRDRRGVPPVETMTTMLTTMMMSERIRMNLFEGARTRI